MTAQPAEIERADQRTRLRGQSIVMTRIGGREYPLRTMPRCKTCVHPERLTIETLLVEGYPYAQIHRSLDDDEYRPSLFSLRTHVANGHMPIGAAAERALIERNYERSGRRIEEAVEEIVDHVAVTEVVMKKGFERMQKGEIAPDMADVLQAVKIMDSISQRTQTAMDQEMWIGATMAMLEDARTIMSAQQWAEYSVKLKTNPILKALAEKQGGTGDPQDI
jgi:hypothetical protein